MAKTKKAVKKNVANVSVVKKSKRPLAIAAILIVIVAIVFGLFRLFVVASVNNQLVFRTTVVSSLEKQYGQKTLDVIVAKMLVTQEAKKKNIKVTSKEIDDEIAKLEKTVTAEGSSLDSLLSQQGMTRKDLNNEMKIQIMLTKLAGSDIKVTDQEVEEYLTSYTAQITDPTTQITPTKEEVAEYLKSQKLDTNIQNYLSELKTKAKINYFIKY